ncbi:MerR family DNA-binding transcriptional regulator [Yinghuangia aomiensis]
MTSNRRGKVRARPDDWLSIGEVSARTGAAVSALRFYEELGLIASERDDRNQRQYPRHMLRRVALIAVAKRIGIPLQDLPRGVRRRCRSTVRPATRSGSAPPAAGSAGWRNAGRRSSGSAAELTGCIGCGCLSMKACALLNPDDTLGGEGVGALRV